MVRFDFKVFCVNFSAYIMSENTTSGQDEVKVNDDSLEEGVITMKQLLEAGVHFWTSIKSMESSYERIHLWFQEWDSYY